VNRVPFKGIFFGKVDQGKESANRRSRHQIFQEISGFLFFFNKKLGDRGQKLR
jgi:hypothetical protein